MLDYGSHLYRKTIKHPWEKWFAWHPVKVHGRYVWLKYVYRRVTICYVDVNDWKEVEYGDIFDLIKDSK